jgi:hypothetical protein
MDKKQEKAFLVYQADYVKKLSLTVHEDQREGFILTWITNHAREFRIRYERKNAITS